MAYTQWKVLEQEDVGSSFYMYPNSLWQLEETPVNVPVVASSSLHNSSSPYFDSYQYNNKIHAYTADMLARDRQYFSQSSYRSAERTSAEKITNSAAVNSESLCSEFQRIYFQELLRFTMNKATFFTLIFSFMFLGCIFFLMGFITASNIYNHNRHSSSIEDVKKHMPSEQALLQGRPAKIVNMGQNIMHAAPKAFNMQSGVRMSQNTRQPSQYVQQQINSHQPNYR